MTCTNVVSQHFPTFLIMPMSTLSNFGGISLDHDALDRVTADWQQQTAAGSPPPA